MEKQPLSWLEFLAYENRINALLLMIKDHIAGTRITTYSLSNNTMAEYWAKNDPEAIYEDIYCSKEILFTTKITFASESSMAGHILKDSYFELGLFLTGEMNFTAFIALDEHYFKAEEITNQYMEMITTDQGDVEVSILKEERKELFKVIIDVFEILRATLSKNYKFYPNEEKMYHIKKYFTKKEQ